MGQHLVQNNLSSELDVCRLFFPYFMTGRSAKTVVGFEGRVQQNLKWRNIHLQQPTYGN
jgi:hypothetical protein